MEKDDYHVIVFKVLTYLYACLKRKILFDDDTFKKTIGEDIQEEYLTNVFEMMQEEGLIRGLCIKKVWGSVYILACDLKDMEITQEGIMYLDDNSMMNKVKEFLSDNTGLIGELMKLVF